ncbi:cAMP-binding domain of CRP or a regulatory subunit of cAMP-dependent protein kinases [Chryseobacterium arachidis]|uniref:cAMP-binding domain of CRP or a regulatory subunit of cAMP-dependent protein kinases n=1 Tax=Chryseobacterium arachidis TaxID=1416778 RepID=A0A1M5KL92_9FLAO|nr:Crp/Fnr family transcriptional regulator [Chryseobacterium arachidis]SHG53450.1 cAMP-binding domain of CRP or a regulatory subunit of cAMP-dependent protein kinases [Chryseobacterium arachidis]
MFETFQKYLTDKIQLSEAEIELIQSVCIVKKLRKKQFLMQDGEVWQYNAFICRGLVKTFSIAENGTEHIISFAPENYWTGDRESLINETPTSLNIDAIEPTELILIHKKDFEKICAEIPQLNQLVNQIIQKSFIVSQSRILANISFSAEEKYQNFIEKYPHIVNRIPQHMIASYIGITPETLTRLRRNRVTK